MIDSAFNKSCNLRWLVIICKHTMGPSLSFTLTRQITSHWLDSHSGQCAWKLGKVHITFTRNWKVVISTTVINENVNPVSNIFVSLFKNSFAWSWVGRSGVLEITSAISTITDLHISPSAFWLSLTTPLLFFSSHCHQQFTHSLSKDRLYFPMGSLGVTLNSNCDSLYQPVSRTF